MSSASSLLPSGAAQLHTFALISCHVYIYITDVAIATLNRGMRDSVVQVLCILFLWMVTKKIGLASALLSRPTNGYVVFVRLLSDSRVRFAAAIAMESMLAGALRCSRIFQQCAGWRCAHD